MANVVPNGALHLASRRIEEGATAAVHAPWTGEELGRVVLAGAEHAEQAVVASQEAFDRLRRSTSHERIASRSRLSERRSITAIG